MPSFFYGRAIISLPFVFYPSLCSLFLSFPFLYFPLFCFHSSCIHSSFFVPICFSPFSVFIPLNSIPRLSILLFINSLSRHSSYFQPLHPAIHTRTHSFLCLSLIPTQALKGFPIPYPFSLIVPYSSPIASFSMVCYACLLLRVRCVSVKGQQHRPGWLGRGPAGLWIRRRIAADSGRLERGPRERAAVLGRA